MKSGDARVALIGFPSVGKVLRPMSCHLTGLNCFSAYFHFCVSKYLLSVMSITLFLCVFYWYF